MKKKNLNPKTKDLLDTFSLDAQHWGCQEEWGSGSEVFRAQKAFEDSKAALVEHLLKLEAQIRELKRR